MKEAAMSFSGTIRGVIVFLLAAVVTGEHGWSVTCDSSQICALKGSTVEIKCSYTYPEKVRDKPTLVEETFWFLEEENGKYMDLRNVSKYSNRVNYDCKNSYCIMKISNLTKSDEATYKFRFTTNHETGKYTGLPGVSLSVTDPQVKVVVSSRISLICEDDCQLPEKYSYIWFKNNHRQKERTKEFVSLSFNSKDSYYCVIEKGEESVPSSAVYAPKDPLLSVIPSEEIVEGNSVTLNCSSDANPKANYTLYRQLGDQNHEIFPDTQAVFSPIQVSNSGSYRCKAENELGMNMSTSIHIDVKHRPKTCNVSLSPQGKVEEGKPVTLTCRSNANPAAQYTFYKHNHSLTVGSGEVYPFHSVSSEDRANYFCKCENKYGHHTSSPLFLDILYAPKLPVVSVTPGEIMEGSLVTLTCLSNANPAASYRWYRENDNPLSLRENLNLNNVNSSASGRYYCSAWNNLGKKISTVNIDVKYAPRSLSVSIIPAGKTTKGSSVTLTCSCDANPAALYIWYKEGHESDKTSGQNFIIENIQQEHSGDYHCKVQNSLGYQNATISVIVVAGPSKLAVIGTMVFIFLIVISLIVFFLLRKQRSSMPSPKPGESPNNIEQCQHTQSEIQEDVQYASLRFLRRQRDPIYANLQPTKTGRSNEKEDENPDVEYATVKFATANFGQRTDDQEPGEDAVALYSAINKIKRPKPDN